MSAMEVGRGSDQFKLLRLGKPFQTNVEWLAGGTGQAPSWATMSASDYAGALASLDAAAAIVRQVAAARKVDAKAVLGLIGEAREALARLQG